MKSGEGDLVAIYQFRIMFFMILVSLLLSLPEYTVAEEPPTYGTETYGSTVPSSLQRMLDAWGKGPFCAGCHNMPYPAPPEKPLNKPASIPVGAIEIESALKRLTYDLGRDVGASYSPNGKKIAWETDRLGNWTIWSMDPDGGNKKQLTSSGVISGWPSWSLDGKEIAYWSWDVAAETCDIWKMNADGSSKVRLTTAGSFKGPPMWSPRGDRIAYTANLTGNMEIYVIDTDGSAQRQITTGHTPEYWVESRVTWHPDGERLYFQVTTFPLPPGTFTKIPDDVAFVEIFLINVDTGYEINLTPNLHENVRSVSPDGQKLACISMRSKNYGVWVMNADGTGQTRLTWDGFGDRAPHFSPDGKKIVYWSLAHGQQPDIWMVNADGSAKTKLTSSPYQDVYPSWSGDGKTVIFESDRSGNFDIWQLSLDELIDVEINFEICASPGCETQALLNMKLRDASNTVRIEKIGLRPDWGKEGDYIDYSDSLPKTISRLDGIFQMKLNIEIPEDTELGYHFYDLRIGYSKVAEGVSGKKRCYECSGGDLEIAISDRAECERLKIELDEELSQIHEREINKSITQGEVSAEMVEPLKGYLDFLVRPEGEYFLKANDEYYGAVQLHRSGRYSEAVNRFKGIEGILAGQEPELDDANNNGIMIVYTIIPLAAIVIAVTLIIRRRKAD